MVCFVPSRLHPSRMSIGCNMRLTFRVHVYPICRGLLREYVYARLFGRAGQHAGDYRRRLRIRRNWRRVL